MIDLHSRDPEAARDLHGKMRDVTGERGEPALWEQWAVAALSVIRVLREHDPVAARDLVAEVLTLLKEILQRLVQESGNQIAIRSTSSRVISSPVRS